jgi:transcription initiation factor IIE alpha subunit
MQLRDQRGKDHQSRVAKAGRKLPSCPRCGKTLELVYENEYWTYTFDEETGTYFDEIVDIEIHCPDCNASLRQEFPEGVCNFDANYSTKTEKEIRPQL